MFEKKNGSRTLKQQQVHFSMPTLADCGSRPKLFGPGPSMAGLRCRTFRANMSPCKHATFPWILLLISGVELGRPVGSSCLWRQQGSSLLQKAAGSRRGIEPCDKVGEENPELFKAKQAPSCSWLARQGMSHTEMMRLRGGSSQYGTYNTPITFFSNNGHIAQVPCVMNLSKAVRSVTCYSW